MAAQGNPSPSSVATDQPDGPPTTTCHRHPDRESHVRCTRCDRYICPDCMRSASVGFHCPDCVREGQRSMRQARTVLGGRISSGPPLVSLVLIALNLAVYAGELERPKLVDKLSMLGRAIVLPSGGQFPLPVGFPTPVGMPGGFHVAGVAAGEWYRLLTGAFVHSLPTMGLFGIFHIIGNLCWLWRLGPVLEDQLGRSRFLALYLVSALGGSVAVYLIDPGQSAIGASGAIFGLVGGYWVMSRRTGSDPVGGTGLLVSFLIWMAVSAAVTSWEGHLGGLLAGAATGVAFAFAPPGRTRARWQAAGLLAVLAALVLMTIWQTARLGTV